MTVNEIIKRIEDGEPFRIDLEKKQVKTKRQQSIKFPTEQHI